MHDVLVRDDEVLFLLLLLVVNDKVVKENLVELGHVLLNG